jgi:hypothetical protein
VLVLERLNLPKNCIQEVVHMMRGSSAKARDGSMVKVSRTCERKLTLEEPVNLDSC